MNNKPKLQQSLQKHSIYIVLVLMFAICSMISPYFLKSNNLINIMRQSCVGLLIAYGEMILIVEGFIDLSAASVLALSGVLSIAVYKSTGSLVLAILTAILVGILCNLFNAFFVANVQVPAFIATLGMQEIARGIALYYCGGSNILQLGNYTVVGQGMVGPIPLPVIILILITIAMWYLVTQTRWGRSLYAIGGNRNAAEASGINVKRSIYMSYIINGMLVGFAGVIFMARNNAGLPNGAVGYEMTGLTAAIVGGTSMNGGIGTITGTVAGAFIIAFLENIMNLIGVDSYIQQMIKGLIVVLAVAANIFSKRGKVTKVIIAPKDEEKKEK